MIQIDVCAEEMGTNVRSEVNLVGDCGLIVAELTAALKKETWRFSAERWWDMLNAKVITKFSFHWNFLKIF